MDHARKLNSAVMFRSYILALQHVRMLALNRYDVQACINTIINIVMLGRFSQMYIKF